MKTTIAKALFHGHSYEEYRRIITDLLLDSKSTGNEQSEALTNYSKLNETRMNRLDKTIKINEEVVKQLQDLKNDYIWLVISEGWCGDSAQLVPIFNKMAEASHHKIDLRLVFRDENEALMSHFLTNNARAVPKLILINKATGEALAQWGPRPNGAVDFILNYKKEHGVVDDQGKADLQMWYTRDKGLSTQAELLDMMLTVDQEILQTA